MCQLKQCLIEEVNWSQVNGWSFTFPTFFFCFGEALFQPTGKNHKILHMHILSFYCHHFYPSLSWHSGFFFFRRHQTRAVFLLQAQELDFFVTMWCSDISYHCLTLLLFTKKWLISTWKVEQDCHLQCSWSNIFDLRANFNMGKTNFTQKANVREDAVL